MKIFIEKHKMILFGIICLLFSGIVGASAAVIIFSSEEVSYDNSESGMSSSNVQDAIDELYGVARLSDRMDELEEELNKKANQTALDDYWETVYPVGSIYISINSKNPSETFGGTWIAYGSGKTLVGVDSSDSDFNSVEKTGGGKTKSYTPGGTIGGTSLTVEQLPSHNHSIPSLSGTAKSAGDHSHTLTGSSGYDDKNFYNGGKAYVGQSDTYPGMSNTTYAFWFYPTTSTAGAHTHSVTTVANTTGNKGSGSTHTHSFTGTAANISTVQPYITVYMWKRTA